MALHTGVAEERDGDYFGPPLNRLARLLAAGHGGQILLSLPRRSWCASSCRRTWRCATWARTASKISAAPSISFSPGARSAADFPPLKTLDARPNNLPVQPTPLIGRERELAQVRRCSRAPTCGWSR